MTGRAMVANSGDAAVTDVGSVVRVPKMAELVAHSLRRQIVRGELAEGDPLPPEAELMRQFGVSRPTLREAFRVLESENLILVRRGAHGGARVLAPSSDVAALQAALLLQHRGVTLADVYRARELIEPAAARALAANRTDEQVVALRAKLAIDESSLAARETRLDISHSFHRMVIEFAGNQTLAVLVSMLDRIIEQATRATAAAVSENVSRRAFLEGHAVHTELVDLVEAGDADGVERLWADHLRATAAYVTRGAAARKVLDLFD